MLSSPSSDRAEYIDLLSDLYAKINHYPSDPHLYETEVVKLERGAAAAGGFGDCFQGLFLGRHVVAMKCSREGVEDEAAFRVSASGLVVYMY